MTISIDEHPKAEEIDELRAALRAYNQSITALSNYHQLYIKVENDKNELIGGIYGKIAWRWLYIDLLWVHPEHRSEGIGKKLMQSIEKEANAREVFSYYVSTASFQAPVFYQKMGYQICGEIKDLPPGYTTYFFKKQELAFD